MRSLHSMVVGLGLYLLLGCAPAEEQVLNEYFMAVQSGDDAALGRIALAEFPGRVQSWELVEIGPESKAPFTLPELLAELSKLRSKLRIENERNGYYAGDHPRLFAEYKKRHKEDPEATFTGELGEFQKEWEERMKRQGELEKEIEMLNEKAQALRSAAALSLNTAVNEDFAGDVKAKNVKLKVNDGSSEKSYTFKLERYELVDQARNMSPISHWIVAEIDDQA